MGRSQFSFYSLCVCMNFSMNMYYFHNFLKKFNKKMLSLSTQNKRKQMETNANSEGREIGLRL